MAIRQLAYAAVLGGLMVALALGLRQIEEIGWISGETHRRAVQVVIGLLLAGYANLMPKQIGRFTGSTSGAARAQAALRAGGWAMTMAAVVYAGLWAFAPLGLADFGSIVVVLGGMAITLGFATWSFAACRTPRGAAAA